MPAETSVVQDDHIVEIHYRLTDHETGEELDSSSEHRPLAYLHGHSQIVPGLERALAGKAVGHKETVTIAAADAYGDVDPARILTIPRDRLDEDVEPGQTVHAEGDNGFHLQLTVTKVEGDEITLDGNHPLAGKALTFDVEVVSVRSASENELSHGHAHCGGGGCGSCH